MDSSANNPIDSLGDILERAPTFSTNSEPCSRGSSEDRYFCRFEGKEAGPFAVSQLQGLIDQGKLQKSDRVRHCESKCWLPCQEIPALVFPTRDPRREEEIEAASSLLDELFSASEGSDSSSDQLSIDDLPAGEDSHLPEESLSPERTPPPSQYSPLTVALQSPPKPKRKRRSKSDRQFSLPSKPLVLGAVGLILILAVVRFWPASSRGIQGVVAIDGTLLTVGSLSLLSADSFNNGMSFTIIEGQFHSAESLPDGEYDAVIVVGSPLGMPVSQLENTPFESLNGARFQLKVTLPAKAAELKLDLSASQAIPLKTSGGADAVSSK